MAADGQDGTPTTLTVLRVGGAMVLLVGLVFAGIGLADFFGSFGSDDMPTRFWMTIVGLPLVGIGLAGLRLGFAGEIGLFAARQSVPAIKVVMDAARADTPAAVRPTPAGSGAGSAGAFCTNCGRPAPVAGRFCGGCGAGIA